MTRLRPIWLRTILAWLVVPLLAAAMVPVTLIVLALAMLDGQASEVWSDLPLSAAGDLLMGR